MNILARNNQLSFPVLTVDRDFCSIISGLAYCTPKGLFIEARK